MTKQDNIIAFPGNARRPAHAPRIGAGDRQAQVLDLAAKRAVRAQASATDKRQRPLTMTEVWDALHQQRIEMHYQPQYDLASGEIMGAEALLRLIDGQGQLVYPDRFIELVEHSDLIVPLGRAVIEQVCTDLVEIRAAGGVLPRVAINLAAHQLNSDEGLVGFIDDTLAERHFKSSTERKVTRGVASVHMRNVPIQVREGFIDRITVDDQLTGIQGNGERTIGQRVE